MFVFEMLETVSYQKPLMDAYSLIEFASWDLGHSSSSIIMQGNENPKSLCWAAVRVHSFIIML